MGRHRLGTEDDALWSAFLEGYAERRQIADVDLAAVPLFVAPRHLRYIGLQTANWDNWGHGEVDDAFFDRELAFLRAWMSTHLPV